MKQALVLFREKRSMGDRWLRKRQILGKRWSLDIMTLTGTVDLPPRGAAAVSKGRDEGGARHLRRNPRNSPATAKRACSACLSSITFRSCVRAS
jgi:hypothetical protein